MIERAGYLPGLKNKDVDWNKIEFGSLKCPVEVLVPVLTEAQIKELLDRVRSSARAKLKGRPVNDIVKIIDKAVARLLNREDPFRKKAEYLLPRVTGYDAEMLRVALTQFLKTFRTPQLMRFLAEDFSNPQLLDGFQPITKGGFGRAFGPDILTHIWAGNVPGLPVWSFVSGLLVKAGSIGKLPSSEPLFAGWFAQVLAEEEPEIAECFAIVWWKGGDTSTEVNIFNNSDVVLAYGNNSSLEAVRNRVPVTTRFLGYGHKLSFGIVSSSVLNTQKVGKVARDAARDVIYYDQQGCYSPHMFFVERGGSVSPKEFARYLAFQLACFEQKYSRQELSVGEARDFVRWRQGVEREVQLAKGSELISDPKGAWAVVYDETGAELSPSGLKRTVRVSVIDKLSAVIPRIMACKDLLQTVGVAATPEEMYELANELGYAGITRISALGRMAIPEAGWHHDGRFSLLDLVKITEIDGSAEKTMDSFSHYED